MRPLARPEVGVARLLRRETSLPEVLLWQLLRGSHTGLRFRRQHPIGPYGRNFFCPAARLIVEVDGEAHGRGDRPERDDVRTRFFHDNGFRLLRLPTRYVLSNLEGALTAIACQAARPLHQPSAGPPPRAGKNLR